MSHFKLISETKASDVVPTKKFVSTRTGLTVIIAGVEGPVVNGFFCLATEAHDDDGLPHTLEHLIFLGSKRYPYKGILDLLANRCLANGTNAWTDTDHTCYTVKTAGDEGMLTLLPIYLDHILHPTLSDEGYVTEVHHIDGEGVDAGVVYCEMQGRENCADSRCHLALLRAFYPNCGYSAETGGIMANLRNSTNNTKVRNYHKKFYRPENLCLILTGQIEPESVFNALQVVEDDIIANRRGESVEPWKKPWRNPVPPPEYGVLQIEWPADSEDCGQVLFGWAGPCLSERGSLKRLAACALTLRYLCDTPTAPLQRHLVEREDALAGDVSYNVTENMSPLLEINIDNVPLSKLQAAHDEALAVLGNIRSGKEAIDVERMRRLVKKQLRENTASLESNPHQAVAFHCIGDMLYSHSTDDFVYRLNSQVMLRELLQEPADYWLKLIDEYFTENNVTVIGRPSIALQNKMAEDEKKRIEAQRNTLGAAGLAEKAKIFNDALSFNEREPPAGTLAAVPIPSCSALKTYDMSTWASDSDKQCPYFDLADIPLYTRLHSIHTNLIYMNLVFDLTDLDAGARKWLTTIVGLWGECPVARDGRTVPYEQVVEELEEISVKYGKQIGFGRSGNFTVGHFGNQAYFDITCEPSEYERVVRTLWEVFFAAQVTKDRLLVVAQRLINEVAQVRRKGNKMAYDVLHDALYKENTNIHWNSVLRQHKFLTELLERLNGGEAAAAVAEAERAYRDVSARAWLHLVSDLQRHKLSAAPWQRFRRENELVVRPPTLQMDSALMKEEVGGCVVGVGGVESNYLVQACGGPRALAAAEVAPLLVTLNYLTQLEGPMWRLIRGCGLSYGYGVRPNHNEARLYFSLFKSTNVVEAYGKAKSIVSDHLASGGAFDSDLFVSAKSSVIFEVVEDEKCPSDVAAQSLYNYLRQVGDRYSRDLVRALSAVTAEQAREAGARWLPGLLDPARAYTAVVCHPGKVDDTRSAFAKIGLELTAYDSIESSHFK